MYLATLLAAAAEVECNPTDHKAWVTILWVIAVFLFVLGIVWFYRAIVALSATDGAGTWIRPALVGVACWVGAAFDRAGRHLHLHLTEWGMIGPCLHRTPSSFRSAMFTNA